MALAGPTAAADVVEVPDAIAESMLEAINPPPDDSESEKGSPRDEEAPPDRLKSLRRERKVAKSDGSLVWKVGKWSKYANKMFPHVTICEICMEKDPPDFKHAEVQNKAYSPTIAKQHLLAHHKVMWEKLQRLQKATNSGKRAALGLGVGQTTMGKYNSEKAPEHEEKLCRYVVDEYLPIAHVTSDSFKAYVHALNPKVQLPSCHRLYDMLFSHKADLEKDTSELLRGLPESITVDSWTSSANQMYFLLTRHAISDNWELLSLAADCIKHEGHTRATDLAEHFVNNLVGKYSVDVVSTVSDCEPSMLATGLALPFDHNGCLAHRLDLVTQEWFKGPGVAATCKKFRELATAIHCSSQLTQYLKDACAIVDVTYCKPQQDVSTRWWSTYLMLSSFNRVKKAINLLGSQGRLVQATNKNMDLTPTDREWDVSEQGEAVLEPFMAAQKMLKSEQYVTGSFCIPLIFDLRASIQDVRKEMRENIAAGINVAVSRDILAIINKMYRVFYDKFGTGTSICHVSEGHRRQPRGFITNQVLATALDPRTKILYGVPKAEHPEVWAVVRQCGADLMLVEWEKRRAAGGDGAGGSGEGGSPSAGAGGVARVGGVAALREDDVVPEPLSQKRKRSGFMEAVEAAADAAPPLQATPLHGDGDAAARFGVVIAAEVEKFVRVPSLRMLGTDRKPVNPLLWWREHEMEFPNLAKLAKRVLCIPATSAPSERLFSVAGQTVTQRQNLFSSDPVELLIYLRGAWPVVDKWKGLKKRGLITR